VRCPLSMVSTCKRRFRTAQVLRSIVLACITVKLEGMAHTSMRIPTREGTLEPDQKPGLLKSLDYDRTIMVRETAAGNACVSSTRWQRVSTVSVPVTIEHAWRPSPSPSLLLSSTGSRRGRCSGITLAHPACHTQRLALPTRRQERAVDGGTERCPQRVGYLGTVHSQ
jgi:hypothetical protein